MSSNLHHFALAFASAALALHPQEESTGHSADLAKQLANPISPLINVPFQANWDFGISGNNATRFTLNPPSRFPRIPSVAAFQGNLNQ